MRENVIRVASPYQGITGVAHGGYLAGLLAGNADEPVQVTLRRPPPLETPLVVKDGLLVDETGQIIMETAPTAPADGVAPPPLEEVRSRAPHPRFADHPYADCFMCGTRSADGFALRVSPPDRDGVVAGVWVPSGRLLNDGDTVGPEFVWAAVDCLSVWAFADHWTDLEWWPALTGRISVQQLVPLHRETEYVAAAKVKTREGRKITVDAALTDAHGRVCAKGQALWIVVPSS